jgi:hypothetical protein
MDNAALVKQRRATAIEHYGPWSTHSTHLGEGVYASDEPKAETRLRRCLQVAADILGEPIDRIRVLDLACLEGEFALEFASHGATVVGIEGREINLEKARIAKDLLSLNNLELIHDDVRNLDSKKVGHYDVVLALGILYHLEVPAVMEVVRNIFDCCTRIAIIDTHFSQEANESYTWEGNVYWGRYTQEHASTSTREEQLAAVWMSIGNVRSFLLTRASFSNLLRHVGFTSVYECLNPHVYYNLQAEDGRHFVERDRITFIAIKGQPQRVMSSPISQASPEIDRPEKLEYLGPDSGPGYVNPNKPGLARTLFRLLPEPTKAVVRKIYQLASGR